MNEVQKKLKNERKYHCLQDLFLDFNNRPYDLII